MNLKKLFIIILILIFIILSSFGLYVLFVPSIELSDIPGEGYDTPLKHDINSNKEFDVQKGKRQFVEIPLEKGIPYYMQLKSKRYIDCKIYYSYNKDSYFNDNQDSFFEFLSNKIYKIKMKKDDLYIFAIDNRYVKGDTKYQLIISEKEIIDKEKKKLEKDKKKSRSKKRKRKKRKKKRNRKKSRK